MRTEIGSEFWDASPKTKDRVYLLSGRTALEYIIRDVLKHHRVSSVLMPSYCCHTMIEPFVRHHIAVRFYDVFFNDKNGITIDIPKMKNGEIFYYMTYFGFSKMNGLNLKSVKEEATVVIEDRTHAWLTEQRESCADYYYASCRKWTGFSAIAEAVKKNGYFDEIPTGYHGKYCELRRHAFAMKKTYIEESKGDKQAYLNLLQEAEELLESDYVDYLPEDKTMSEFLLFDRGASANIRRRNATTLMENLKNVKEVKPIFHIVTDTDAPLFLPVLVSEKRDELRSYLAKKSIYCPIHWPLSQFHNGISDRAKVLYQQELSLVCDQRYDADDMKRIAECILTFYSR